jgi:hypothetical protein
VLEIVRIQKVCQRVEFIRPQECKRRAWIGHKERTQGTDQSE